MCQPNPDNPESFIYLLVKDLEEKIAYQQEKVGEIFISLPPRLWAIENKTPKEIQLIFNGLGQMMMFLVRRYEKIFPNNNKIYKLLDTLFEKEMTFSHASDIILQITQTIVQYLKFETLDNTGKFSLYAPQKKDFGSKKIYFKPLYMMVNLFIDVLADSQKYKFNFSVKEKEWRNFVAFVKLEYESKKNSLH